MERRSDLAKHAERRSFRPKKLLQLRSEGRYKRKGDVKHKLSNDAVLSYLQSFRKRGDGKCLLQRFHIRHEIYVSAIPNGGFFIIKDNNRSFPRMNVQACDTARHEHLRSKAEVSFFIGTGVLSHSWLCLRT